MLGRTSTALLALLATSSATNVLAQDLSLAITASTYAIKDAAALQTACAVEFGTGATPLNLDADLPNGHQWSSLSPSLPDLQRFTHYWATAEPHYLTKLSNSRGVVLEYLWGQSVEPVLMGDQEMPSFLKVQVLCKLKNSEVQKKEERPLTASSYGHLHINTWSGETLDVRRLTGTCHMTLLEHPHFAYGPLTVQVRTKSSPLWSYIESAVLQLGEDRLQVTGGDSLNYWINGKYQAELETFPFPLEVKTINARQREFRFQFGDSTAISIKTFHQYVRVDIDTLPSSNVLEHSFGLWGSYPEGEWIGHDQTTRLKTANEWGHDWVAEDSLFTPTESEGECAMDLVSNHKTSTVKPQSIRRRLNELSLVEPPTEVAGKATVQEMTMADAKEACERVHKDTKDRIPLCVEGLMQVAHTSSHKERMADEGVFADVYHALFNEYPNKKEANVESTEEEE